MSRRVSKYVFNQHRRPCWMLRNHDNSVKIKDTSGHLLKLEMDVLQILIDSRYVAHGSKLFCEVDNREIGTSRADPVRNGSLGQYSTLAVHT